MIANTYDALRIAAEASQKTYVLPLFDIELPPAWHEELSTYCC